MASYSGGLKINNKELGKFVDRTISKTVRKIKKEALPVAKELREESVIEWFFQAGFPYSHITMLQSLDYDVTEKQANGKVMISFTSYINPALYEITHTSLYKQRERYDIDPFTFIVNDLQWEEGIIGLPAMSSQTSWVNSNFHQTIPLHDYVNHKFQWNWKKRLKKHGVIK